MTKEELKAIIKSGKREAIITSMRLYQPEFFKNDRFRNKDQDPFVMAQSIFSSA